jgi:hypothetical protein
MTYDIVAGLTTSRICAFFGSLAMTAGLVATVALG